MVNEGLDINVAKPCADWIASRDREGASLYYTAVRRKLELDPRALRILSIERPHKDSDFDDFVVTVQGREGSPTLKLYHARNPYSATFGLIGIKEIDGRPIKDVVVVLGP